MGKKPAPMSEDEGDVPLHPPLRSNSQDAASSSSSPIMSTPNQPSVNTPPTPQSSRTRRSQEARAKMEGMPSPGGTMKARAKLGDHEKETGAGVVASNKEECAPSRAVTDNNPDDFPHTLNKTPYPESSEYTSRDNIGENQQQHRQAQNNDIIGHGAFAIRNPSGNNDVNTSMVDNLMEPQESAPGSNGSVKGLLVAAEVASTNRDREIQEEAERLRQQIWEMQQQGEQQEVVVAVPADDEKSAPEEVPDEAAQARRLLGKIVAFCLVVGAIAIAVIFLVPPSEEPPKLVSDLPCVSESEVFPLGLCVGDCDNDEDCQDGLECFQRNGGEAVPGCSCGQDDSSRTDYCVAINFPPVIETNKPPYGICQGDCDTSADCQTGLICYQRSRGEPVPGCSGGENDASNNDYCIDGGPLPFLGVFGDRLIGSPDDNFGTSVSISKDGTILAVGAPELGSTGYVDIYSSLSNATESAMASWTLMATIRGDAIGEAFGSIVSLSGDGKTVAVGSVLENRNPDGSQLNTGSVRVFQASDDLKNWVMIGEELMGDEYEMDGDKFEFSIALSSDGTYVAIGQMYSPTGRGTLLFRNDNDNWMFWGSPFSEFRTGSDVTLATAASGDLRVAINGENSVLGPGQVHVSELGVNGEWTEIGQSLGENDGAAIALSDDGTIMALSITNRTSSLGDSGPEHVAVYRLDNSSLPTKWSQMGVLIPIPGGDVSNEPSIALSSDGFLLAIGEPWHEDVGRVRLLSYNERIDRWEPFGDHIIGNAFGGFFGAAISLVESRDQSKLAVGAPSSPLNRGARGAVSCYQVLLEEDEAADATFSPTPTPTASPVVSFEEVVYLKGKESREAIGTSLALSRDGKSFAYTIQTPDGLESVRTIKYDSLENQWDDLGTILGDEVGADFGRSLSFSGDGSILAIGIPKSSNGTIVNKGRIRVLSHNGTWNQIGGDIVPKAEERFECFDGVPVPDDVFCRQDDASNIDGGNFGFSISISEGGSILAVGSPFGYDEAGQVDIYEFQAGDWIQVGGSIVGPKSQYGKLGWSVSLSSDGLRVAAGARTNGQIVEEAGAARIYEFQGGSWQQIGEDISGLAPGDRFGGAISLSADGEVVAIGSVNNDNENGNNAGHVRVYNYSPETNWTQMGKDLTGIEAGDQFGSALSLSGTGRKLAIGSQSAGYIQLFDYDNDNSYWRQTGNPLTRPREAGGGFGSSVLLAEMGDGSLTVAVGSPLVTTPTQLFQPDSVIGEIHVFKYGI
ncbi:unnamed protein product [Cylindrotheca closterium]|uniref:Uncharacterized protein n=1 Tax=Cylindrotheca closterium TaxID=2856 RepID=A0AAD2G5N2_9STRA|nr:unnamed protein product [Cylindrotheca closterium]